MALLWWVQTPRLCAKAGQMEGIFELRLVQRKEDSQSAERSYPCISRQQRAQE